jgi:hypothetical protein
MMDRGFTVLEKKIVINFISYKLCKLFVFNVFPNVLYTCKPFHTIYTIFTWSLQKFKRGILLYLTSNKTGVFVQQLATPLSSCDYMI